MKDQPARQEAKPEAFEKDVRQFIEKMERRGLEVDVTAMEEGEACLDIFRAGKIVAELVVTPRQNRKGADSGVKAECVKCHAIMACPFYGSDICRKFTIH